MHTLQNLSPSSSDLMPHVLNPQVLGNVFCRRAFAAKRASDARRIEHAMLVAAGAAETAAPGSTTAAGGAFSSAADDDDPSSPGGGGFSAIRSAASSAMFALECAASFGDHELLARGIHENFANVPYYRDPGMVKVSGSLGAGGLSVCLERFAKNSNLHRYIPRMVWLWSFALTCVRSPPLSRRCVLSCVLGVALVRSA